MLSTPPRRSVHRSLAHRTMCPRALVLAALLVAPLVEPLVPQQDGQDDILYELTDSQYYSMPELFELQPLPRCRGRGGVYCLGSFQLSATGQGANTQLYALMQRYSLNWVHNFNHTRVHRGLCLHTACPTPPTGLTTHQWFSWCVNSSMQSSYNLSARPLHISYCTPSPVAPLTASQVAPPDAPLPAAARVFAAVVAALLAFTAVSTVLDLTLGDDVKKGHGWALSWSLLVSWRALWGGRGRPRASPPSASPSPPSTDLRALDGLRVFCMLCVVVEHVCWLTTQHYLANTREYELMRVTWDAMLMANSTLVVQIFFLMSSFLLAHKMLQPSSQPSTATLKGDVALFADTMINRIVRVSPSYWLVVWFAAAWWPLSGAGPLWQPLVQAEAAVCKDKWWTHLLYLNNVLKPDHKCLIQTWYLAADMQLYCLSLLLLLVLRRHSAARALVLLTALLVGAIAALAALAYYWRLLPTYAMHNPELVRATYSGESSFNVLYQSPLGNSPGALAGLLLAFAHHWLSQRDWPLHSYRWFRWSCQWSPVLALVWAAQCWRVAGGVPPPRAAAAALAALERPVFAALVSLGLLGAMHHVESPLRRVLSWRVWAPAARLSYGVLLLHMPLNKSLVAQRQTVSTLNRNTIMLEFCGVSIWSYMLALPLALLVELPAQQLYTHMRKRYRSSRQITDAHKQKAHIQDTLH